MKQMKKLASVLLIIATVFVMSTTAFAANTNAHTITITNDKEGHTYTAYQVFKGDITGEKLTNIEWGNGVKGTELLSALKALDLSLYKDCATAEDVADVLVRFEDDSEQLDAFAKVAGEYLATAAGSTSGPTDGAYTINVNGDGYYLVMDSASITGNDAATKYILKVVKNITVDPKSETPTIDKVIVKADSANGGEGKGTAQDVGSVVDFKLTSTVPEMDGYDTYTYIVNDTMSEGLTAVDKNNDGKIDVAVTIDGDEYTAFTVAQNGQSFTITFNNFIDQKSNAGKEIVITYSATINENALTTDVETNTANLEYSNNPNDDTSKGKTPDKIVYIYDFDIVIDKYVNDKPDGETGTRLADAMFVLKNKDGQYYHWDEENTKVEWIAVDNKPESTDQTSDQIKEAWEALGVTVKTTDGSGAASFQGLDSGKYYLEEIAAPAGYNLLKGAVEVTIEATYNNDGKLITSSATSTNGDHQYQQVQPVENKAGVELPSTGGIGTTIFYVLGAALVIIAGVLLVTRRRMNKNN